jgi:hypothetical protein
VCSSRGKQLIDRTKGAADLQYKLESATVFWSGLTLSKKSIWLLSKPIMKATDEAGLNWTFSDSTDVIENVASAASLN